MRKFVTLLALAFLCAVTYTDARAASLARVAASVNGDIITAREVERAAEPDILQRRLDPKNPGDAAQIEAIRRAALDNLITEKILLQDAARQGITVSDETVNQEIQRIMAESQLSPSEFEHQLQLQGLSMDILRERVRTGITTQILIGRMVHNKVVVTEDEINAYYRAHGGESLPSGKARVALIVYPADAKAEEWASRIASGKITFAEAARQVSVGPNPQGGGDLGFLDIEDLAPALREAVEGLKPGQVSGLFNAQINKAQVQLVELAGAAPAASPASGTPDAATAARIEEIIRKPRLEARFAEYTAQLRAKALVDIRY